MRRLAAVLAVLVLASSTARADPELAARIGIVDDRIAEEPGNADLYARRAVLRAEAAEWTAALADLDRAETLRPDHPELGLLRARVLLGAGRADEGRAALDAFVAKRPDHAAARIERARLRAAEGDRDGAVRDWDVALAALPKPVPDFYLERARLLLREPARTDDALAGIEQGVKRLGTLVTLVSFAVDAEAARARPTAALAWVDRLPKHLKTTPLWIARRADLLDAADRSDAALSARCDALAALRSLPPSRRGAPANAALHKSLTARTAGRCAARAKP